MGWTPSVANRLRHQPIVTYLVPAYPLLNADFGVFNQPHLSSERSAAYMRQLQKCRVAADLHITVMPLTDGVRWFINQDTDKGGDVRLILIALMRVENVRTQHVVRVCHAVNRVRARKFAYIGQASVVER